MDGAGVHLGVHRLLPGEGLFEAPLLTGDEEDLGAPIAITLDELDSAIAAGHVEDAKTIVALHLYDIFLRTTFPAQADPSA